MTTAPVGLATITHLDFASRVAVALLLGAIVGLERQWRQRMAGLRTNALVATGTSLFVMLAPLIGPAPGVNALQIPAYVVSGIGSLAGGVIFKERLSITGLNTAATLWCTAAVGVCGILVANVLQRPIVARINMRPVDGTEVLSSYEIRAVCRQDVEERVRGSMIAAVRSGAMSLTAVYSDALEGATRVEVTADVTVAGRPDARLEKIVPTTDDEREMIDEA